MSLAPATRRRLDALARRYDLPPGGVGALGRLLELQAVDPTASTTVREPEIAVDRHIADSLAALDLSRVRAAGHVADLGPGAGWPGLALAAALPGASVVLVESASRHCRYLERAVETAGLGNVEVVHARAEEHAQTAAEAYDLVTARALAALNVIHEYAAPLLCLDGMLVAWKAVVSPEEAADGAAAATELGLEVVEVRAVTPYPDAREHTLHVLRKIATTPPRFPRRPGMATKRPLSA